MIKTAKSVINEIERLAVRIQIGKCNTYNEARSIELFARCLHELMTNDREIAVMGKKILEQMETREKTK